MTDRRASLSLFASVAGVIGATVLSFAAIAVTILLAFRK